ncbi:MAG: hypothetical protein GZ091_03515 [Paludibacter sp.]|nr:hypothetical protein [Paludibacter sp.]
MKKVNFLVAIAVAFGLTTLVSCNGDFSLGSNAAMTVTATDEAQVASMNDEVISSVEQYAQDFENSSYQKVKSVVNVDSVLITVDSSDPKVFPKVITIDFGTNGYIGKRGNVLKGKIIVTLSGRMALSGSTRTITYDNFFINDNQLKGSKIITNNGLNTDIQPSMTTVAKDTIIRAADGKVVTWNSNRTRTRIDNNATPFVYWDDTFSITGSTNGVNAKGITYTNTIDETNPLIIIGGYPFFVKGKVIMESENRSAVMDYGDGTKDNKATLTINGVTKAINLKR